MRHMPPQAMVPQGFVMAMRASLAEASYDAPHRQGLPLAEWLILCRWGAEGEYLTIAQAGAAEGPADAPPPLGLRPRTTFLGLRLAGGGEGESFLLARYLPAGMAVAGTFQPSDGIARLFGPASALRLEAAGRSAFRRGLGEAGEVRIDVPDPSLGGAEALSWRMEGWRAPWLGEFLAPREPPPH
ncbi:hypothetical protein JMJ56_11405 [Belnapia sp. T18]|uniref:Uncharacterized protein n=1 Tax=Belnapia arida TaxID=2804533 RepID=A0ABS1U260_9PROT|nr:hypothetical protein [Belnapia arida]MBL6078615.1 hypothetical protein [Belnapia arida]